MSPVRARPSGESEHWSEREPRILSCGAPPRSFWGSFAPAGPSHQSSDWRSWRGWSLTGTSRNVAETSNLETKHHTCRVGEFRFITLVGPEELTLQALSPKQRGYRVFIHVGMIKQIWKEQDKGDWDKLQFLVLWVPTFWDYMTYVIQTLQGASWVTEAEGAGGYVKF